MFAIERIAEELREAVAGLEPERFAGRDAARLAEVCARGERLFAAAKILFAARAADTNGWRDGSSAVTPEQWLARKSGIREGNAREALKTARRVKELPATEERLRDGSLSLDQASLVSKAAAANPDAEQRLLRTARREGLGTLRDAADRVISAATDEDEAHTRAKRERHFRTWRNGLATCGAFSGPTEAVAELLRALEPIERRLFDQARKDPDQPREPYEARMFDALVTLAHRTDTPDDGESPNRTSQSTKPVTRLRVDLDRLLDHDPDRPGEICEIPGVGPVPVSHARRVLPHGLLELVITDGVDVATVVSRTRHVPEALKVAVAERDQRCKIRGCDTTHHLERHHTEDFATHQLTSYAVLGMLCGAHHDLVSYHQHQVVDHHDGTWSPRPPDHDAEERRADAA